MDGIVGRYRGIQKFRRIAKLIARGMHTQKESVGSEFIVRTRIIGQTKIPLGIAFGHYTTQ